MALGEHDNKENQVEVEVRFPWGSDSLADSES